MPAAEPAAAAVSQSAAEPGNCEPFVVFARNWDPVNRGTAVRDEPYKKEGNQLYAIEPNHPIEVDIWVETEAPYPNPPPFDTKVWFRVEGGGGWVARVAVVDAPKLETGYKALVEPPEECRREWEGP